MVILARMIQIQSFTFNPFDENTYVLFDESKEAVIIDPGCYEKEEQAELGDFINEEKAHNKIAFKHTLSYRSCSRK